MLANNHFYFELTRKYVTVFGNLFNNIILIRTNTTSGTEIERIKVPLVYAPRDKMQSRLREDPALDKPTQVSLPRMSFEISGMGYDSGRKQISLLRAAKANSASRVNSQYMGVPYDFSIDLNIYAKTIDEGNHIVEQILPYFNPQYTVTTNLIPDIGIRKDIPVILNSVNQDIQYEGNFDSVRYVTYTLNFTLKAYFFGPISYPKIIRKVITNIYNDPKLQAGYIVRINTSAGNNGTFKLEDTVFQGEKYDTATAYGTVHAWQANTGKLTIAGVQGQFTINSIIRAVDTNARYNIASFDASPLKLVNITIEPDPINAEPNSDYGYSTTITEWPNT